MPSPWRSAAIEGGGTRYKFGTLEATPIVEDGIMYVPDGWGRVYAIDVSSGKKGTFRWKFDPETDRAWAGDVACCGVNNRGVALWKDKIISISLDGRLFALNKATGEKVWERKIADPAIGETLTLAPLVVRDVAIVGTAGGEYGIRGFIDGTDLNTGKQALAHLHDPRRRRARQRNLEGRPGALEARRRLDLGDRDLRPGHRHVLPGHRQCRPRLRSRIPPRRQQVGGERAGAQPGDGKIKWGFQYTPNDPYDFDEISEHPIINAKINGEDRKLVVHAARNGFYYALDRINGSFVTGKQYVDELTWTTGLDPKTGKPLNYDPTKDVQVYAPGSHGLRGQGRLEDLPVEQRRQELAALGLQSRARPPVHLPTIEGCNSITTVEQKSFVDQGGTVKPRERFAGGGTKALPNEKRYGAIKAVDPATGETKAAQAHLSELWRRAGDRRQSRLQRPDRRHSSPPMTARPCRRSGASTPAPASMRRRSPIRSTASSTSPCWWARGTIPLSSPITPSSRTRRRPRCCTCSACEGAKLPVTLRLRSGPKKRSEISSQPRRRSKRGWHCPPSHRTRRRRASRSATAAHAQGRPDQGELRGLKLGLDAKTMTTDRWGDFACGSNGGPPRQKIADWSEFAKCRAEESGLHEVYVRFDDEDEYVGRAIDDPLYAAQKEARGWPAIR